jgi:hypothetical protein
VRRGRYDLVADEVAELGGEEEAVSPAARLTDLVKKAEQDFEREYGPGSWHIGTLFLYFIFFPHLVPFFVLLSEELMHFEFLIGWCDVALLFLAACFLRRRLAVTHDFTSRHGWRRRFRRR